MFHGKIKVKSKTRNIWKGFRFWMSKVSRGVSDFFLHWKTGGPLVALDFLGNKLNSWDITDYVDSQPMFTRLSSLSDTPNYVQICKYAAQDPSILRKFKSEVNYMRILEHVDFTLGRKYLHEIHGEKEILDNLRKVCSQEVGSPKKYHYSGLGKISPTQLRYAKILCDLKKFFGSLDGFRIAEIGVGNGGQSLHICNLFDIASYTYYDLPEVQDLVKTILKHAKMETETIFPDIFNLQSNSFDLVIANYSFSELRIDDQRNYLENVVIKSQRGYMILNDIKPNDWETISIEELGGLIPNAKLIEETPQSHPGNRLIVWGN